MSARNMAKRTAAGTLALSVCLGGGALALAGSADGAPTPTAHLEQPTAVVNSTTAAP